VYAFAPATIIVHRDEPTLIFVCAMHQPAMNGQILVVPPVRH
jgi:hypothetical protein